MRSEKKRDPVFVKRLDECIDELKWLYMELYQDEHAFEYFTDMLYQFYTDRSKPLKKWDEKRIAAKDWYKGNQMLGMVMYANAFAKNISGVHRHLDYIEECGINYLHLMPLLESPEGRSDGGYAVSDFRKVEPSLGTIEDLAALSADCHKRGISVCLDFVMNHTSEDHEWAVKAKQGDIECQNRYFFYDDWTIPNEFEKTVPQVFPTTAPGNFSWNEETGKIVMTTFYPYQWDLNYANPTVFNDMTANMLFLCNNGVDIIRLDAVPYIWKELGTTCRNLPQVHNLVRMMHMAADVVCPGTLLLGEVVMEPSKVVPYFGTVEKPECQMLYNVTTMASTWHTLASRSVKLLSHQLETVFALPKDYTFLNYLRCHDDIGWGLDYDYLESDGLKQIPHKKYLNDYLTGKWPGSDSRGELYNDDPKLGDARLCGTTASLCGIEAALYEKDSTKLEWSLRLDIMLHAFLFTQSGVPVLYSGDEIGQLNDYSYHDDPFKKEDSRYLHRGDFDWKLAEKRNDPSSPQGKLFLAIKKMTEIRKQYDVFNGMADTWLIETGSDHVLGIGRYYNGQKLLALFNFSEHKEQVTLKETETYMDLMSGKTVSAETVEIDSWDFRWLFLDYGDGEPEKPAPQKKKSSGKKRKKE
ncbi:MAG: amylosucrase [Solobacterium sp.]|nr:amylosucrase [Solobacterium sp.]